MKTSNWRYIMSVRIYINTLALLCCVILSSIGKAADKPAVFQVLATVANNGENGLVLNNKLINGKPKAIINVTQCTLNAGTGNSIFSPHAATVSYDPTTKFWYINYEDAASIPNGVAFNVRAVAAKTSTSLQVDSTITNSLDYFTLINNKATPSSLYLVTHNEVPDTALGAVFGIPYLGVVYDSVTKFWAVANENRGAPTASAYNVVNITGAPGASLQTATSGNIVVTDYFEINDATANNNPNAIIFVTPNITAGNAFHNGPIGVFYRSDGAWCITSEDTNNQNIEVGETYNVQVYGTSTPTP